MLESQIQMNSNMINIAHIEAPVKFVAPKMKYTIAEREHIYVDQAPKKKQQSNEGIMQKYNPNEIWSDCVLFHTIQH